ncbi:gamma-glutamyltranspeptidase/glutathione hydrolase [Palleronia aestuarii]|uniref:Glutathione hydrolase proenzyme n=1 Tax=Palleronia aestuarii TaxID=568105 RepID=A0A2W7NA98_9RHOB|nr:gamma-glutamyltransferase [Palleronia aestuarii]PZX17171.1 gamma-glutamyltranspeptidase/glutathione hydrolase [Palleronia aestuarii]
MTPEKTPARGYGGVVVTNHPRGTAAGYEMLAAGGNAVDAAVASLLALCVVEPMMVGIAGGGMAHIRLADGSHRVIDGLAYAPAAMKADSYEPVSDEPPDHMETVGQRSKLGPTAVAVPGNLAAWCGMQERFGKLPFADVIAPAIGLARRGFAVTHYLAGAIGEAASDFARDPAISNLMMPNGTPLRAGDRLVQGDFAEALAHIEKDGAAALHGGALGAALADRIATGGEDAGWLDRDDLAAYEVREREVIRGSYRGHEVIGPPPPASSGVHVVEMLNLLEHFDVAGLGFGTKEGLHLMARVIRLAFEDRRATSGDPDFVDVPVEKLTSKAYAEASLARLDGVARDGGSSAYESADTTHVTVADRDGNVVSATHTINGIFGARFMVPGTGIIPNNYMMNFDPHPGRALSVAPGKRVPTSMAPMMVLKDGRIRFALGLPGGLRIFPSALQAIVNLVDHAMPLQEAIESPRIWTEGHHLEVERALEPMAPALRARGHEVRVMPHVGGGMNAISFGADGVMEGAACWRADGTVAALGGGEARPGIRFWPDRAPERTEGEGDPDA